MPPDEDTAELALEDIAKGTHSAHAHRRSYDIRDQAALEQLWEIAFFRHSYPVSLPAIDFQAEMVLAAFTGEFPTSGYRIEILRALDLPDAVHVYIRENRPAPEMLVTQALTQPYHIVKVRRADKSVVFEAPEISAHE